MEEAGKKEERKDEASKGEEGRRKRRRRQLRNKKRGGKRGKVVEVETPEEISLSADPPPPAPCARPAGRNASFILFWGLTLGREHRPPYATDRKFDAGRRHSRGPAEETERGERERE